MPIDRNSAQYITGAIYKPTQTSAPGVWDLDDQANNVSKNLWPLPPQAVQRSLRFNSADNAYLNRTFASGNQKTWTWSGWVKRGKLSNWTYVFQGSIGNPTGGTDDGTGIRFVSGTDELELYSFYNSVLEFNVVPNMVFRDTSAWYHIIVAVDTTQSIEANRVKMYVNGSQTTFKSTASGNPTQNKDTYINTTNVHTVGALIRDGAFGGLTFDGYLADIYFIDGQQLTASSFGETDPQTGVWIPKRYTGTYGTNGFRLSFANNSSTTALGYDSSGQGNNWTANNFSVTPGVGNDVFVDVPSLYGTDTGLGGEVLGNYCTWNPNDKDTNVTLANGNLDLTAYNQGVYATWLLTSGKWYYELTLIDPYNGGGAINFWGYHGLIGVQRSAAGLNVSSFSGIYCNTDTADNNAPGIYQLGTRIFAYTTFANNDIIGLAADIDNKTLTIYRNGTVIRSNITLANINTFYIWSGMNGTSGDPGTTSVNFGQRPFAYPAPSGYKALCTTNLPAPAIGQTSSNQADNHFDVLTYVGNGSARSITGLSFQPDLVWIKQRTGATTAHSIQDSVRGVDKHLTSNGTDIEVNSAAYGGGVTAFNANGFSIGTWGAVNENTQSYVAWCWNAGGVSVTNNAGTNGASVASTYRANRAAGFSIVIYTGTGVGGATIAHGLGVAPKLIITKARLATGLNWAVYHASLGATKNLWLSNVDPVNTQTVVWNDTAPSSAVFTVGSAGNANSTQGVVAYCWAEIPGFSAFGSYTGNASTDGSFVYTGFKPAFILIKDVNNANSWILMDNKRTGAYNPQDGWLVAQAPDTEYNVSTSDSRIDFLSNGFKLRNSNAGNNGSRTYIYAAFAETPARLSTAR